MTKNEAIYKFFSSFDMVAYPISSVPDDVTFPYLTYENNIGCTGDIVSVTVNLWYHTDSEKGPNAKAEEMSERIGRGGMQIAYDGGTIWIRRGRPWSTALSDANDSHIKRRMLNLEFEYL